MSDQEPVTHQHHHAECVQPVIHPDRQFPDVYALEGDGMRNGRGAAVGLVAIRNTSVEAQLVYMLTQWVIEVDGTGDARVEGVDGAENLDRLFRVCDLRSDQRRLVGGTFPRAVAGEAFQVLGTTSW